MAKNPYAPWNGIAEPSSPAKKKNKINGQWTAISYQLWYDERFRNLPRESQLLYIDMRILNNNVRGKEFIYTAKRAKQRFGICKDSLTNYIQKLVDVKLIARTDRSFGKPNKYKLLGSWDSEGWQRI